MPTRKQMNQSLAGVSVQTRWPTSTTNQKIANTTCHHPGAHKLSSRCRATQPRLTNKTTILTKFVPLPPFWQAKLFTYHAYFPSLNTLVPRMAARTRSIASGHRAKQDARRGGVTISPTPPLISFAPTSPSREGEHRPLSSLYSCVL